MSNNLKQIVKNEVILLTKEDVMELTGWCQNVTNRIFAYDTDFPAIKIR